MKRPLRIGMAHASIRGKPKPLGYAVPALSSVDRLADAFNADLRQDCAGAHRHRTGVGRDRILIEDEVTGGEGGRIDTFDVFLAESGERV